MKTVKRIEIVTDALELQPLLKALEGVGVSGYTVIPNVVGKGERGLRQGDELTGVFQNSYVLAACPEEILPRVLEVVRPILRQFGGVCLVSDAQWIIH